MSRIIPLSVFGPVPLLSIKLGLACLLILSLNACRSTYTGRQWEQVEDGLSKQVMVLSLASDPEQPEKIWAGTYAAGGMMASKDGGNSWQIEPVGVADNPVFDLLIFSDSLWAATRDGLFYLDEGSTSWHRANGLPEGAVFSVTSDGDSGPYAGLDNMGLWRRLETGWEPLHGGSEALSRASVLSLKVTANGQQLYAGTAGHGVFASRDAGSSWVQTYPDAYVANIAVNPANENVTVASLRNRLVRTRDGGQSWHTLPLNWARDQVVSLLWLPDGTLGAGTSQGELYRSRDSGDTWQGGEADLPQTGILAMLVNESAQLLAGTWTGLYTSYDQGQSWTRLASDLGLADPQALLQTGRDLLLGTRTGIYQWNNDAGHWVPLPGQTPSGAQSLARNEVGDEIALYAGTSSHGLYRSIDGGRQWRPLPTLLKGISAVAVNPLDSDQIYYLAAWERVYESNDGGVTWQARWDGLGDVIEAISLAVDPSAAITYVGTETGLYRSSAGQPWDLVAPELADQSILALLARPTVGMSASEVELLIGTTRGVFRSFDRGESVAIGVWGKGLENISVTALLANPKARRHLVAGTAYNGVYESFDNGQSWLQSGSPEMKSGVVKSLAWGPDGELFVAATNGVWRTISQY